MIVRPVTTRMKTRKALIKTSSHTSCGGAQKGFTLIELVIALTLLALISTVLFGVFRIAGDFVEKGAMRTEEAASIRLVEDFLRAQWENAHPLRQRKNLENPLIFEGKDDQVIYISALPPRVLGGGLWAWRLRVVREEHGKLILERALPDTTKENLPSFSADLKMRSVLADRVKSVAFEYYGVTGEAANAEPQWSKSWDDPQRMPQMIRMDVTMEDGTQWPTLYAEVRKGMEAGCRQWNEAVGKCTNV